MEPTVTPAPTKTLPVGPPQAATSTATKMAVNREVEETPAAPTPARTTTYNVRELLELERKIYDESIEKQGRLYEALQQGTLHEYLVQCLPLESDRDRALEVAKTRFQLSRRNASDLLAFELKQAGDVYEVGAYLALASVCPFAVNNPTSSVRQAHCLDLKHRLRAAAERKRARVVQRLEQIQHGLPLTVYDDADPLKMASENDGSESPSDASILMSDGSLDTVALEKQLAAAHAANLAAFNLDHLEHNLPPARAIVADVVDEVERHRAFLKEVTDPDTVCGVVVDPNVGKVWIGHMDVFAVLDHVVVWSRLSDEEFYGQIVKVHEDRIALALLCGSLVSVSVEQLRKQLCTLRQQEISASARLGMIDERMARTPKRKRHRRKHTIGMRQKI